MALNFPALVTVDEFLQALGGIRAETKDFNVTFLQFGFGVTQTTGLNGTAGCHGFRVKIQHRVWAMKKFMGREFMGVHRVTFVIDEDGKLAHVMAKVKTKTHHDDLLAVLDSL